MKPLARPSAAGARDASFPALLLAALVASCASGGPTVAPRGEAAVAAESYPGVGLASDPVPTDPALREGVLPNGLRYYLLENRKPEGRAFLRLFVDAGSVLETEEERGLAHFVEHMAFNGTERFPKNDLVEYLRSLGMRFGPEINAYTSFEETFYVIEVPVEGRAVPEKALAVLDDWSRAMTIAEADVEAERGVILEEHRMGLGAMDRVRRVFLPAILGGSPYAERLPIGLPEVIRTAPASRLRDFYRKWYRPDNMGIAVVGNFDAAALEARLAVLFPAPPHAAPLDRPRFDLAPPKAGSFAVVSATDPELPYGFVQLYCKGVPREEGSDVASFRSSLIDALAFSVLGERFDEATVRPETPYAAAGAGEERYGLASNYFALTAVPEPGSAEATLRELLLVKEGLVRHGFSAAEIARAKRNLLASLENAAAEKDKRDSQGLSDQLGRRFLSAAAFPTPDWELAAARALLEGIGAAEVSAAVRARFAPDDLTVVLIANSAEAASLPSEARARELAAEARAAAIEPPAEEEGRSGLLDAAPAPGAIASEKRIDLDGPAVEWTLANGARVLFKKTRNTNDQVSLFALAPGGYMAAPDADAVSAVLASALAQYSGLGPFSRADLQRALAGVNAQASFFADEQFRGFQGGAAGKDLKALFELLHLGFADPRLDEAAAAAFLDLARTSLLQRRESPEGVFSDAVADMVSSGHPRYAPLTAERLGEVSLDGARRFLEEGNSVGGYYFAFVGNAEEEVLRGFVETYLASLPARSSALAVRDVGLVRPAGADRAVKKGKEDKALVFLAWFAPASLSPSASVAAELLEEYLDIRLTREIREKLGGVYSASADAGLSPVPEPELSLSVSFSCDPARADELSAAAAAELAAVADGAVDGDAFAKAKEALLKAYETALQSDGTLAYHFARYPVVEGASPAAWFDRPSLYRALEPSAIRSAAAALRARGSSRVVLTPEK